MSLSNLISGSQWCYCLVVILHIYLKSLLSQSYVNIITEIDLFLNIYNFYFIRPLIPHSALVSIHLLSSVLYLTQSDITFQTSQLLHSTTYMFMTHMTYTWTIYMTLAPILQWHPGNHQIWDLSHERNKEKNKVISIWTMVVWKQKGNQ